MNHDALFVVNERMQMQSQREYHSRRSKKLFVDDVKIDLNMSRSRHSSRKKDLGKLSTSRTGSGIKSRLSALIYHFRQSEDMHVLDARGV